MVDKPDGCAATQEQASEQVEEMSQQVCYQVQHREMQSTVPRKQVLVVQKRCHGSKIGHESVMHPLSQRRQTISWTEFPEESGQCLGRGDLFSALVRLHL